MTLDIQVAGLQLRYGAVTALDDLSFTLPGGRIYGLLGRNGSGNTSLLSVLAGFRAICLAGLLPGAAVTWVLVRDLPIRNRVA